MTKCVRKNYDVSFKLQVLSDYYLNGLSKNFTCKKWGISFPALLEWLKIWPVEEKELPLLDEIMSRYRMEAENKGKSDEQILQERIVSEKNRTLVRMINEQAFPGDSTAELSTPLPSREGSGESLFNSIDTAIRTERLYINIGL